MSKCDAMTSLSGKTIVILTPTFNDWVSVNHLIHRLDEAMQPLGVKGHVIIINDGSTDCTGRDQIANKSLQCIELIQELALTCNQGNQRALAIGAGYIAKKVSGDYLVIMDSDLEDQPAYIPKLLHKCLEENNKGIVFAERTERSEGRAFRFMYRVFQKLFHLFTGVTISVGNFSIVPWEHVPRLANLKNLWHHYSAAILRSRIPYSTIPAKRGERLFGKSKMHTIPLITHAFGGISVYAEVFAIRGLVVALAFSGLIVVTALILVGLKLWTEIPISGWTSVSVGLLIIGLLQIITTAMMILFLVLSLRSQNPLIPALEFERFTLPVIQLYPCK